MCSRHLLPLLTFALVGSAGCGGDGRSLDGRAARGRVRFTVTWPTAEARVIPSTAQSLRVEIKQGAVVVGSQLVVKPTTTATFAELPVGSLTLSVAAYASPDGTGTVLANATVPVSIAADATTNVDVTLASAIDRLEFSPSPLVLGALAASAVLVTAKDAVGNVVLVAPASLRFVSSTPSVASVDSSGVVTAGGSVGTATVTVTEADSGKTANLAVSVVPSVAVLPSSASVTLRGTQSFASTVQGPANGAVVWSVQEGAAGGSVASNGVYTAPATKGTYHVVATSVADPSRKAVATVAVSSGLLNVGVH